MTRDMIRKKTRNMVRQDRELGTKPRLGSSERIRDRTMKIIRKRIYMGDQGEDQGR